MHEKSLNWLKLRSSTFSCVLKILFRGQFFKITLLYVLESGPPISQEPPSLAGHTASRAPLFVVQWKDSKQTGWQSVPWECSGCLAPVPCCHLPVQHCAASKSFLRLAKFLGRFFVIFPLISSDSYNSAKLELYHCVGISKSDQLQHISGWWRCWIGMCLMTATAAGMQAAGLVLLLSPCWCFICFFNRKRFTPCPSRRISSATSRSIAVSPSRWNHARTSRTSSHGPRTSIGEFWARFVGTRFFLPSDFWLVF